MLVSGENLVWIWTRQSPKKNYILDLGLGVTQEKIKFCTFYLKNQQMFKILNTYKCYGSKILKEDIVDHFLASSIIQLSQKEPLFIPDNSKSFRNRVITISSNENAYKFALKTFAYFSNVFLKCLNLDFFNLKFSSFITYNIKYKIYLFSISK
jgi:hypothetical protein